MSFWTPTSSPAVSSRHIRATKSPMTPSARLSNEATGSASYPRFCTNISWYARARRRRTAAWECPTRRVWARSRELWRSSRFSLTRPICIPSGSGLLNNMPSWGSKPTTHGSWRRLSLAGFRQSSHSMPATFVVIPKSWSGSRLRSLLPNLPHSSQRPHVIDNQVRASSSRRSLLFLNQMIFIRIDQRLPACVDDILADADGAEDFAGAVGALATAFDHHAHAGGGLVLGVDHAHLVINQMNPVDRGVVRLERAAQGAVQRVHRAIPLGHPVLGLTVHAQLDRRLRNGRLRLHAQDHHAVMFKVKKLVIPADLAAQ